METNLKATLVFSKEISPLAMEYLSKEFHQRYILACNTLNPYYKKWNKEFDKLYPEMNGKSEEYLRFITERQNEVLKKVNTRKIMLNLVEIRSSGESDWNLYGYAKVLKVWIGIGFVQVKM